MLFFTTTMKYVAVTLVATVFTLFSLAQSNKIEHARYQVSKGNAQAYSLTFKVQNPSSDIHEVREALFLKDGIFRAEQNNDFIEINLLSYVDFESVKDILLTFYSRADLISKETYEFKNSKK